jgi:hypothetical protein
VAQVAHFIAFCTTTTTSGGSGGGGSGSGSGSIVGISGIEACKVGGEVEVRGAIGCQ